jgi:hypothetical protein
MNFELITLEAWIWGFMIISLLASIFVLWAISKIVCLGGFGMSDKVVVDIVSKMPHACIVGPLNEPHVLPIEAIKRMADGRNPLIQEGQEREDTDLVQGIISDWLALNGHGK